MVGECSPNEGNGEEREKFWSDLDGTLFRVGNGYRLYVLRDLNRWIGDSVRAGITGAFGDPGENNNRRVVDFCAERVLCVGNTYFKHKSLHKYTRVAKGQDIAEVNEHDKSSGGEEGYAELCEGCEGNERNGMRHLRSPCYTV